MRPKIVIALLLAGLIGLSGIIFLKKLTAPAPPVVATVPAPTSPTAVHSQIEKPAPHNSQPVTAASQTTSKLTAMISPVPVAASNSATDIAATHADDVQARVDRLQALQANDDPASLRDILGELTNSDKTVRAAAVESTIQFGSRDAIPVLKDLAVRAADPAEKKQLLDAADFLALPTLTEIRAQKPDEK